MTATVDVVEFAFSNRVINIDCLKEQFIFFLHLDKAVNSGGGFFGNAAHLFGDLVPMFFIFFEYFFDECVNNLQLFVVSWDIEDGCVIFGLNTTMNQQRGIAAVINNLIRAFAVRPGNSAISAFPIFLQCFTLPGENRNSGSRDSGGGMILSRENIA